MQKKINDIDNTWYEIQVGLQIADFLGTSQKIRKMILQLKMLKLDVGILMDLPYPQVALSGRESESPELKVWKADLECTTLMLENGGDKCK